MPITSAPTSDPLSHERVIDAIVSTLTPDQMLELARETIAAKLGENPASALLNLPATASTPHSLRHPKREVKDYLGEIADVTVVSKDKLAANSARIIFKSADGTSFMWDATSANGLALEPGQKKRITATIVGPEGGHLKITRVRFYDRSAKPPVRFSR